MLSDSGPQETMPVYCLSGWLSPTLAVQYPSCAGLSLWTGDIVRYSNALFLRVTPTLLEKQSWGLSHSWWPTQTPKFLMEPQKYHWEKKQQLSPDSLEVMSAVKLVCERRLQRVGWAGLGVAQCLPSTQEAPASG